MKTKEIVAVLANSFRDKFVIRVFRSVKNSSPKKEEIHYYSYDYNSDHIYTVTKRFSKMIELHHKNVVEFFRKLNENETSSSGK